MNETNLKPRELECTNCKATFISDQPNVKCRFCGHILITVIKSVLTELRFKHSSVIDSLK